MKKLLLMAAVLVGAVSVSQAGVRVNIDLGFRLPPPLIVSHPPIFAPRVVVRPPVICERPVYDRAYEYRGYPSRRYESSWRRYDRDDCRRDQRHQRGHDRNCRY